MNIGHKYLEHSYLGLGSTSSLKRWLVVVQENLRWSMDCLIVLMLCGLVAVFLLLYSVLFVCTEKNAGGPGFSADLVTSDSITSKKVVLT